MDSDVTFDVITNNDLNEAFQQAHLDGTLKGKITIRRLLWTCGARRITERKKDGIWLTEVRVFDKNKWLLAKIKYGF